MGGGGNKDIANERRRNQVIIGEEGSTYSVEDERNMAVFTKKCIKITNRGTPRIFIIEW